MYKKSLMYEYTFEKLNTQIKIIDKTAIYLSS